MQHTPTHDAGCHAAGSVLNDGTLPSWLASSMESSLTCLPHHPPPRGQAPFVDVLGTMEDPSLPLTVEDREEWGDPVKHPQHRLSISSYCPVYNVTPQVKKMTLSVRL